MVSWWPGDGNANDIQGSNNSTLSGGVTFAPGEVDQAFTFNGTDGEVILPNSSSAPLLNFGPNDSFTMDAWLKPSTSVLGTTRVAVSLTYVCSPEALGLILLTDGSIDFGIRDSNNISVDVSSPASIVDGQWHHATGVRDVASHTVALYLDGVSVASLPDTTTGTFTRADGQNRIGSIPVACPTNRYFWQGQIDEVEVFNRALSASEVKRSTTPAVQASAGRARRHPHNWLVGGRAMETQMILRATIMVRSKAARLLPQAWSGRHLASTEPAPTSAFQIARA
jgi:concanavalin A-like lectin/glucanase superfamily protein